MRLSILIAAMQPVASTDSGFLFNYYRKDAGCDLHFFLFLPPHLRGAVLRNHEQIFMEVLFSFFGLICEPRYPRNSYCGQSESAVVPPNNR